MELTYHESINIKIHESLMYPTAFINNEECAFDKKMQRSTVRGHEERVENQKIFRLTEGAQYADPEVFCTSPM